MGTICETTGVRIGEALPRSAYIDFTTYMAEGISSYSEGAIDPSKI